MAKRDKQPTGSMTFAEVEAALAEADALTVVPPLVRRLIDACRSEGMRADRAERRFRDEFLTKAVRATAKGE